MVGERIRRLSPMFRVRSATTCSRLPPFMRQRSATTGSLSSSDQVEFSVGDPSPRPTGDPSPRPSSDPLQNGTAFQTPTESQAIQDDSPVECGHDSHPGFTAMDEVFDIDIDYFFKNFFSTADLYMDYARLKKMEDFEAPDWPAEADEDGNRVKTLSYTIALNNTIGPKSTKAIETQTLYGESRPGSVYYLDSEAHTPDVPYGSSFYLHSRFCITRVGRGQTRININSQIKYKGRVFSLVKGIIEKNVVSGTMQSYTLLTKHLRAEEERQAAENGVVMRKPPPVKHREKRRSRGSTTSVASVAPSIAPQQEEDKGSSWLTLLFISLVVLLFLNVFLYYNLRRLEAGNLLLNRYQFETDSPPPDWPSVLASQRSFHEAEMRKWQEMLNLSSQLLSQMQEQIAGLQTTLDQRFLHQQKMYGKQDT